MEISALVNHKRPKLTTDTLALTIRLPFGFVVMLSAPLPSFRTIFGQYSENKTRHPSNAAIPLPRKMIHKQLNERVSTESWSEAIETALLKDLENATKTRTHMAKASSDALMQAKDTANGFAENHPVYAILIA